LHSPVLKFKPIDLAKSQDLCIQFRVDAFVCSLCSADRFYQEAGVKGEKYLRWLTQRMAEIPNSCIHVWSDEQIIGQLEMGHWQQDASVGYINFLYLAPAFRGQGLGKQLDRYAADCLRQLGCHSARLSVSPTNQAAMRFYRKQGWVDLGKREDIPEVHYLERQLDL
jgi:ribosomal protein S18 acetylase RimI-like enzyme